MIVNFLFDDFSYIQVSVNHFCVRQIVPRLRAFAFFTEQSFNIARKLLSLPPFQAECVR